MFRAFVAFFVVGLEGLRLCSSRFELRVCCFKSVESRMLILSIDG